MNRCKHQDLKSVTATESVSADIKTSRKEEEGKSEYISGKSQKSLCSIPGCDFISSGVKKETEMQDHFRIEHTDSELTDNSRFHLFFLKK